MRLLDVLENEFVVLNVLIKGNCAHPLPAEASRDSRGVPTIRMVSEDIRLELGLLYAYEICQFNFMYLQSDSHNVADSSSMLHNVSISSDARRRASSRVVCYTGILINRLVILLMREEMMRQPLSAPYRGTSSNYETISSTRIPL